MLISFITFRWSQKYKFSHSRKNFYIFPSIKVINKFNKSYCISLILGTIEVIFEITFHAKNHADKKFHSKIYHFSHLNEREYNHDFNRERNIKNSTVNLYSKILFITWGIRGEKPISSIPCEMMKILRIYIWQKSDEQAAYCATYFFLSLMTVTQG